MMEEKSETEASEGQVLIRVYAGGQESPQLGPFMSIGHLFGQLLGKPVKQEYIFVSDIREKQWGPHELVNWLEVRSRTFRENTTSMEMSSTFHMRPLKPSGPRDFLNFLEITMKGEAGL